MVFNKGLLSQAAVICAALSLPVCLFSAGSGRNPDRLLQAARIALQSGDFAQADELYTSAIPDLEAAGPADIRLAPSLVELGAARAAEGRCQQAVDLIVRGIHLLDAAPQSGASQRSEAWEELAKAYHCQRQYSKAEQALSRALDIEHNAPSPRPDRLVELLAGQGMVYQSERKFAQAETVFRSAQSVLDRSPRVNPLEAALLLNNHGLLLRLTGRTAESEATFRRGLALVESAATPDPGMEASLLDNLASLDLARKQYHDAAVFFSNALRLIDRGTSLPPRTAAQILHDYALCLRKLGDRDQAKSLDTRAAALQSSQPDGDPSLVVDVAELSRHQ